MRKTILVLISLLLTATIHSVTRVDSLVTVLDSIQVSIQSADSIAIPVLMQQRGAIANHLSFMQLEVQPQRSVSYGDIALESAIQSGDTLLAAQAHLNIGSGYLKMEDYRNAAEHFHDALGIYVRQEDRYGQCLSLNFLGVIFRDLENYSRSEDYFRRSLEAAGEDKRIRIRIFTNLGNLKLRETFYTDAVSYYEEAYYLSEELGLKDEAVNSRIRIASVYEESGELNRAYSAYRLILQQDDLPQKADVLNRIGKILMKRKDYEDALDYLLQSEKEYAEQSDTLRMLPVLQNLAETRLELGSYDNAIEGYTTLMNYAQQHALDVLQAEVMLGMVRVYRAKGDAVDAEKVIELFFERYGDRHYLPATLEMLEEISQLYRDRNDLRKALEMQDRHIDYLVQTQQHEIDSRIEELMVRYETELIDSEQELEHQRQQKQQLVERWDDREKKVHQLLIRIENLENELKDKKLAITLMEEKSRMDHAVWKRHLLFVIAIAAIGFLFAGFLFFLWRAGKK